MIVFLSAHVQIQNGNFRQRSKNMKSLIMFLKLEMERYNLLILFLFFLFHARILGHLKNASEYSRISLAVIFGVIGAFSLCELRPCDLCHFSCMSVWVGVFVSLPPEVG